MAKKYSFEQFAKLAALGIEPEKLNEALAILAPEEEEEAPAPADYSEQFKEINNSIAALQKTINAMSVRSSGTGADEAAKPPKEAADILVDYINQF